MAEVCTTRATMVFSRNERSLLFDVRLFTANYTLAINVVTQENLRLFVVTAGTAGKKTANHDVVFFREYWYIFAPPPLGLCV